MTHPTSTPWGKPDTVTEIAPGIISYSTPSHGGFWLSPERVAEMPKPLREFVPFGGPQSGPGRWFEEDCDWSVVALAFPQFFPDDAKAAALATLKHYKPELYSQLNGMAEEPEPQTFRTGQYVTFPSGLGGTFSARVVADNADGTYALHVLNTDFEELKPDRVRAETITPMADAEQRYWRIKELDRQDPHRAR